MPIFKEIAKFVEAYKLPEKGEAPSDGLIFFLKEKGMPLEFLEGKEIITDIGQVLTIQPGYWILKNSKNIWVTYSPEIFKLKYEVLV